jgi:Flp pilus assembly pilin Flp
LIAVLIAVVCVEALTTVGTKLSTTLVSIAGSL